MQYEAAMARWHADLQKHEHAFLAAQQTHTKAQERFAAEQARFNQALAQFRQQFERSKWTDYLKNLEPKADHDALARRVCELALQAANARTRGVGALLLD